MWVFGKFGGKCWGSSRSVVTRYHSPHSPLSHLLENLDSRSRDILRFHSTLNISLKYRNISCPSHLSYVTNCGIEFPTSRLCFANWIIWSSRPAWQLDKNSQRTFRWGQLSKWQAEREREREQSQNYLFGDNLTNLVQDCGGEGWGVREGYQPSVWQLILIWSLNTGPPLAVQYSRSCKK